MNTQLHNVMTETVTCMSKKQRSRISKHGRTYTSADLFIA